jgi:hypothetical protein
MTYVQKQTGKKGNKTQDRPMKCSSFSLQNRAKGENCAFFCTYNLISDAIAYVKSDLG